MIYVKWPVRCIIADCYYLAVYASRPFSCCEPDSMQCPMPVPTSPPPFPLPDLPSRRPTKWLAVMEEAVEACTAEMESGDVEALQERLSAHVRTYTEPTEADSSKVSPVVNYASFV